jgi:hypothetical protein
MAYRPFGKFTEVASHPVGAQWPEAPEELRRAVDGDSDAPKPTRFEKAVYRWLAAPRFWPRRRR